MCDVCMGSLSTKHQGPCVNVVSGNKMCVIRQKICVVAKPYVVFVTELSGVWYMVCVLCFCSFSTKHEAPCMI